MTETSNAVDWKISNTDGKVQLWIRSSKLEEIFIRLAGGRKESALLVRDGGLVARPEQIVRLLAENPGLKYLEKHQCWLVGTLSLPSDRWSWGSLTRPITYNGFNARFLSVVGLGDGLSFPLELPMSRTMLREFGKAVTECCRELIVEYGKVPRLSGSVSESDLPSTAPRLIV